MKYAKWIGLAVTPWLLVACSHGLSRNEKSAVTMQTVADVKIEYEGMPRYLSVSKITQTMSDDLLVVYVEFTNADNDDREGYYRTTWLDAHGVPVWGDETWKTLLMHGNQKQTVKLVAPTSNARDFKVQFNAKDNWRK